MTKSNPPTSTVEEIFDKYFPKSKVQPRGFTNELTVEFANWMLDRHRSEFMQAITRLIQEAELQARANAYYEAADLFSDRPEIYKILWDKRHEVLAQLKGDKE